MEREALAALEKNVDATRVLAAEKSVYARSLASPEPMRFQNEIATAILAVVVLAAFLAGRELGMFASRGDACPGLRNGEFASITFATDTYSLTLDTNGFVTRDAGSETKHPGVTHIRVPPEAVREIANRMMRACFLYKLPPSPFAMDAGWGDLTLRTEGRVARYHQQSWQSIPTCGGGDDIDRIERMIMKVARVNDLFDFQLVPD